MRLVLVLAYSCGCGRLKRRRGMRDTCCPCCTQALSLYSQIVRECPDLALSEYARMGQALQFYQVRRRRRYQPYPA